MREILFRGKEIYNGAWVYGDLSHYKNERTLIRRWMKNKDGKNVEQIHEVKPETVGQYTGLKDKNGTRIFEADIMDLVAYGFRMSGYVKLIQGSYFIFFDDEPNGSMYLEHSINTKYAVCVGNIHDNPELLD